MSSDTQADNPAAGVPVTLFRFPPRKKLLVLIVPVILLLTAVITFYAGGLARRTFIFYAGDGGRITVEERMLTVSGKGPGRSRSQELDIMRYVEEALLGPVSQDSLPLFPRETRLLSLMYRDGIVYVNLSEDAALPAAEGASPAGRDVLANLQTLDAGIKRNFSFVNEVRFFIAGKAAYAEIFR